jgi:transcriptional regulator with XRE-family HTH domain
MTAQPARLPPLPIRGDEIRRVRITRRLTVTALAKKVGTSKGVISDVENGKRGCSDDMLARIARALRVRKATLIGTEEPADVAAAS